jgi:hypothetical protein
MAEFNENDFETQIGRAQKDGSSCTFVRVIHLPTGKERVVVGIGNERNVVDRLTRELVIELEAGR